MKEGGRQGSNLYAPRLNCRGARGGREIRLGLGRWSSARTRATGRVPPEYVRERERVLGTGKRRDRIARLRRSGSPVERGAGSGARGRKKTVLTSGARQVVRGEGR